VSFWNLALHGRGLGTIPRDGQVRESVVDRNSLRIEVTWPGGRSLGWLTNDDELRESLKGRSWFVYEWPFIEGTPGWGIAQELVGDDVGALMIARHGNPRFIKIIRGLE